MKILLSIFITIASIPSVDAFMVVSDVDDTIKLTNSGSTFGSTWSGLFIKSAFLGMPAVYQSWKAEGAKIYFVTGSPPIVGKNMHAMMKHNKVPYISITFRSNMSEDTVKYKMRAISKLFDRHPEEQVVLIGDDVTVDHDVFKLLNEKYPGRVLAMYVHQVKKRGYHEGQIPWVTAFDVAVSESDSSRVKGILTDGVRNIIIRGDKKKLFPSYAWCPKDLSQTQLPTEHTSDRNGALVKQYIEALCQARQ